jgi:polysaccharide export outer membrane protein
VFEVRVFGEEKLSGKYQVGPDGTIRFPFLGVLPVKGREAQEVAAAISDALKAKEYLRDPQVSVFVIETNSRRISVLGAVAKPGTFTIVPGMTVVQAVSSAGGFTALASKDDTVVTRRVSGKLERYRVAVSDVTRGAAEDFPLRAGDIVFVPERLF